MRIVREIWKPIKGYEGLYEVSNLGRVKSLSRQRVRETIMKPEYNKGYLRVTLSKDNHKRHWFVHRLVAEAFIPNNNKLPYVNHINEDSTDNRSSNLEWCTHLYNLMYGTRRQKVIDKERKPVNQYTTDGVLVATHMSIQQASRTIGKNASAICDCCQNKQHIAYGYIWRYAERDEVNDGENI